MRKVTIQVWTEGDRTMGSIAYGTDHPARELSAAARKHFLHLSDFLEKRRPITPAPRSTRWEHVEALCSKFGFCTPEALAKVAAISDKRARGYLHMHASRGHLARAHTGNAQVFKLQQPKAEAAE